MGGVAIHVSYCRQDPAVGTYQESGWCRGGIKVEGYGAIGSDGDEDFFLIQFTGTPFLLQSPAIVFGCHINPDTGKQDKMLAGAVVVEARQFSRVHRAKGWYEPVDPKEPVQLYWIQHVVSGNVAVQKHDIAGPFKLTVEPCVVANKQDRDGCRFVEKDEAQALVAEIHVMSKMDMIVVTAEDCVRDKMNEDGDSDSEEEEDEEESGEDTESEDESEDEET